MARSALNGFLLSLGQLEPLLRARVTRDEAEAIALRCAHSSFANVDLRLRAHFGIYADALIAAQRRFAETTLNGVPPDVRPRLPRRMTLPHIEFDDERSVTPAAHCSLPTLDAWVAELEMLLRLALRRSVSTACHIVLNRGATSLARTSVAVRLVFARKDPLHSSLAAASPAQS